MVSGVWQDAGEDGARVVVEDEQHLHEIVSERFPYLPYIVFGHSLGSMIARALAPTRPERLAGLALGGVVSQMKGLENEQLVAALEAAIAERGGDALDSDGLSAGFFDGVMDDDTDVQGPTDWGALDRGVVADHAADPFKDFGAPMTLRFARSFVDIYHKVNDPGWCESPPTTLPALLLGSDQDPTAHFGEGTYHVASSLWGHGLRDVRTHVYPGVHSEIHSEPSTRADVEGEIVAFVEHCADRAAERG